MQRLKQVIKILVAMGLYIMVMDFILKELLRDFFQNDRGYIVLSVLSSVILFFILKVETFFICLGTAFILMLPSFLGGSLENYLSFGCIFLIVSIGLSILIFSFHLLLLMILTFLTFIKSDKIFPIIAVLEKKASDVWDESEKKTKSKHFYVNCLKKSWFLFLFLRRRSATESPNFFATYLGVELFKNLKKYVNSNENNKLK